MVSAGNLLSYDNPVFVSYVFWGTIVILKIFFLALLTSMIRIVKGVFINPEDAKAFGPKHEGGRVKSDDTVERVRRNHLNDLENIPAFLFLGLFYVLSNPTPSVAIWHFRVFAIARILHTIAYQGQIPQPSRASFYFVGLIVCVSMAVQLLL